MGTSAVFKDHSGCRLKVGINCVRCESVYIFLNLFEFYHNFVIFHVIRYPLGYVQLHFVVFTASYSYC